MLLVKAVHTAAANHQRPNGKPRAYIQPTGPLRAQQGFVAGETQHVDAENLHVQRQFSGRLRRIYDQQQAVPVCKLRRASKVGSVAGHVGSAGHHQRTGLRAQEAFPLVIPQAAFFVHTGEAEVYADFPQMVQRPQDRVVLTNGRDNMVALAEQSAQRRVQCLGSIGCECNAGRVRCIQQLCHCAPRRIHQTAGVQGRLVGTASRVARRAQSVQHGLLHLRRFVQSGGGIVQIDHGFTTLPAWVSFSTMVYILVTLPTASFSVRP